MVSDRTAHDPEIDGGAAPDAFTRTTTSRDGLVMALHELSNAMTVVLGLAAEDRDPAQALAEVAAVARAGLRVARAVEGAHDVDDEVPGDGLVAVARVVRGLRPFAAGRGVRLVLDRPAHPAVIADTNALAAIAWNLLKNAIEASAEGDTVRAEARAYGRLLELRFVDAGHGMQATPRARGRGVGLKVALELAEQLGAELRHEPGAPSGTVASVIVPLLQPLPDLRGTPGAGLARPASFGAPARRARVLLVEDDGLLRGLVAARLAQAGHVVVEAADRDAALEPGGPFDVVLLDFHLGAEPVDAHLVAALRARSGRVVAVTGDPSPPLRVDHVLRKPFDVDELIELVDRLTSVLPAPRGHDDEPG